MGFNADRTYRLVIVDDHQAVRELLESQLAHRPEHGKYQVVGQGSNGQEAVELCLALKPDLLVLDLILPDFSGVEVLTRLRETLPGLRVIFFTGSQRGPLIDQALSLGAEGYVLKKRPLLTLLKAIERVCAGQQAFDPEVLEKRRKLAGQVPLQMLTAREKEVVRLIALGKSTKEAADVLGLSAKTVDKHRTNLMNKLGVHDAVALTHYAIAAGLISVE